MARSRLEKEFAEISKDDDTSGVKAVKADGKELRHLKGTIKGSSGTPYEGGVFVIDIVIPKQYPFEPPKMKFDTKIWHPNISSQTGAICLVSHCFPLNIGYRLTAFFSECSITAAGLFCVAHG